MKTPVPLKTQNKKGIDCKVLSLLIKGNTIKAFLVATQLTSM